MKARNATIMLGLSVVLCVIAAGVVVTMRQASAAAHAARTTVRPWSASLSAVDAALAEGDVSRALMLWHPAYVAVLYNRYSDGVIEVGDSRLKIERAAGFPKVGESKARELYLLALSRAKRDGSPHGVLRAAAAFDALGDRGVAAHARKIAATLDHQQVADNSALP